MSEAVFQDTLFGEAAPPRALTVRQPWASLIMSGGKDVENRSRPFSYRGTLLIHAGLGTDAEGMTEHGKVLPEWPAGVIIGTVELVACVRDSRSPWAEPGYWHWILRNPRLCAPVRATGKLTFGWRPDAAAWEAVRATLR
jgi:hypothetical protein